ncbi:AAA family ATPase [Mycolicibacterium farcinogenes]|uniref:AAA family ATPase n=1 Tax=Mycolicibacterium farcinogenes TaxID=1802 RepID=A0ACD1FQW4_MYCFR|nr:AAA family ATPase [Mycolicibacterium farcinogenes]QZH69455.1 AAA family ATPase [Mycolicibacterium farcinogenes]
MNASEYARDYLDQGIAALGLLGDGGQPDPATALRAFERATEADPGMCDAWVGRAAAGDVSVSTLRTALHTSSTLHRETRRIGLDDRALCPVVPAPAGYLDLYPTTPVGLALAHAVALISAGEYDSAEKTLDDIDLSVEPRQTVVHTFVGTTLHFVTRRWTDVVAWSSRTHNERPSVLDDAIALLAGIAHTSLGQFESALALLAPLTDGGADPSVPAIIADAHFYQGLCHRSLNDEPAARTHLQSARVDGQLLPGAQQALRDQTYGPIVTTAEAIAARVDRWNPDSGPSQADLKRKQQQQAAETILAEAEADLMNLVGLRNVKAHVLELRNIQRYDQILAQRGIDTSDSQGSLHTVLTGPPGTAKTSIARIMCRMYFGLGILDDPGFIEVKRQDLVGAHIGATEEKTSKVLNEALGRALFIDEAPTLFKEDLERDFGRIALDTIMTFAEDHRRDTIIFLAGYAQPMKYMMSANPGLRGRFPHRLEFDSYSPTELVEIADVFARSSKVTLAEDAREHFARIAAWLCATPASEGGFGDPDTAGFTLADIANNGRFVRNVLDRATGKMKHRLIEDSSIDLATADLDAIRTVTLDDMRIAVSTVVDAAEIALPPSLNAI